MVNTMPMETCRSIYQEQESSTMLFDATEALCGAHRDRVYCVMRDNFFYIGCPDIVQQNVITTDASLLVGFGTSWRRARSPREINQAFLE